MTITINRRTIGAALLTLVTIASLAACTSTSKGPNAQAKGQALTQQAYAAQSTNVPYPASKLTNPIERKNIVERDVRYNDPNKISYIYLLSSQGGIYAYFTIKGKVTDNSSQLTTTSLVDFVCDHNNGDKYCDHVVVAAPGDDGSYGPNEPGIFFFTQDNVMVTWDGPYLLTDAPMKVNPATVTLTYVSGSTPTSTGAGK